MLFKERIIANALANKCAEFTCLYSRLLGTKWLRLPTKNGALGNYETIFVNLRSTFLTSIGDKSPMP